MRRLKIMAQKCGANSQDLAAQQTHSKLGQNLISAANEGKLELIRLLVRCNANIDAQHEQTGNTALHEAARNGYSESVRLLCKLGANVFVKNQAQCTPLHMAALNGHNESARILLGANPRSADSRNSCGDTPLHTAARYGHAGVARILLSAKCEPNQVNKNHDTPLHIAAATGRRKLTRILMQSGCEPAIKNKDNETAMDIALRKDLIEIQEIIANPPASNQTRRHSNRTQHQARHQRRRVWSPQLGLEQLSQIELRYSKLDLDLSQPIGQVGAGSTRVQTTPNPLTRNSRLLGQHHRLSHAHLPLAGSQAASDKRKQQPADALISFERELAVDVPAADLTLEYAKSARARTAARFPTIGGLLASVRSGSCPSAGQLAATEQPNDSDVIIGASRRAAPNECGSKLGGSSRITRCSRLSGRSAASARPKVGQSLPVKRPLRPRKLSLVQLRSMVKRRQRRQNSELDSSAELKPIGGSRRIWPQIQELQTETQAEAETQRQANDDDNDDDDNSCPIIKGRRFERLQRDANSANESANLRAPNGIKLKATRPLASLADQSQLYAIPKKSKAKQLQQQQQHQKQQQQQQQVACTGDRAASPQTGQPRGLELQRVDSLGSLARPDLISDSRIPSAGPALTSDGGHSSSQSSLVAACPPQMPGSSETRARDSASNAVAHLKSLQLVGGGGGGSGQLGRKLAPPVGASLAPNASSSSSPKISEACRCGAGASFLASAATQATGTSGQRQLATSSIQESGSSQRKLSACESDQRGKPSKLRQLFHFESRRLTSKSKPAQSKSSLAPLATNHNSSLAKQSDPSDSRAHSPVVQSNESGQLRAQDNKCNSPNSKPKSNWLKSKFSLSNPSSSNCNSKSLSVNPNTKRACNEQSTCQRIITPNINFETHSKPRAESDKLELSSNFSDQCSAPPASAAQQSSQATTEVVQPNELQPQTETADQANKLIRPKSALSSASADLIAAQRSLATAAAAKVRRDRLVKLGASEMLVSSDGDLTTTTTSSKESVLTVKLVPHANNHTTTTTPTTTTMPTTTNCNNYAPGYCTNALSVNTRGHSDLSEAHHIAQVGAIQKSLINSQHHHHLTIHQHHSQAALMSKLVQGHNSNRLGDNNSVGMTSESSPSNNGAESDNSIATNQSGNSLGTENASPASNRSLVNSEQQTPSPLGILSRILLNNKSLLSRTNQPLPVANISQDVAQTSSCDTSAGSSTIDSPPNELKLAEAESPSTFEHLMRSSRSRQPILEAAPNERISPNGAGSNDERLAPTQPRLPARSALKSANNSKRPPRSSLIGDISTEGATIIVEPPVNGLPRVSSLSHLSNAICDLPAYNQSAHIGNLTTPAHIYPNLNAHQSACQPLSSYQTNTNGSLYQPQHYPISPSNFAHSNPFSHRHSHDLNAFSSYSQHDLRSMLAESSRSVGLNVHNSSSHVAYAPHHPHPLASSSGHVRYAYRDGQYSELRSLNGEIDRLAPYHQQQVYSHDDSIYIPPSVSISANYHLINAANKQFCQTPNIAQRQQQQQRPKSSLDRITTCAEDSGSNREVPNNTYGQLRLTSANQRQLYGQAQQCNTQNNNPSKGGFYVAHDACNRLTVLPSSDTLHNNAALVAEQQTTSDSMRPLEPSALSVGSNRPRISIGGSRTRVFIGGPIQQTIEEHDANDNGRTASSRANGQVQVQQKLSPSDLSEASTIL